VCGQKNWRKAFRFWGQKVALGGVGGRLKSCMYIDDATSKMLKNKGGSKI